MSPVEESRLWAPTPELHLELPSTGCSRIRSTTGRLWHRTLCLGFLRLCVTAGVIFVVLLFQLLLFLFQLLDLAVQPFPFAFERFHLLSQGFELVGGLFPLLAGAQFLFVLIDRKSVV